MSLMTSYNRGKKSGSRRNFNKRDSGRDGGKREMYSAVCDKCGKECKVPFKPTSGKPIYCNDCFERPEGGSSNKRSSYSRGGSSRPNNSKQLNEISEKLDKIISLLSD